ncbi:MAG TPA: squalene--hopene cyclase [Planctomycetota bacterium]|nr:squalene--hopene cyclase [Planctomycetota bacterium]OQC19987.1 MAG: Squalene--hopene cyclase [Planctomycetes bacterium ADurb.Bin069]HNR99533.1 squalene--hopene cyclase [Planctomycetota bacterium]HNU26558.1 squalene--hopene cyclase [Planctomycetota bacterium]HOE30465.1 squalene--hopene cyclase [Planctomycetota bacterium]
MRQTGGQTTDCVCAPGIDAGPALGARLDLAVERARDNLAGQQREDGHLCAQLEADITLESDLIIALHFLGRARIHADLMAKAAREILAQQLPGGGFSTFPGGPPDVSATVKAYFALKLAGYPADAEPLARARAAIAALGGITRCNTYTRFYLALFGQYDWKGVPEILPEIMLLLPWFPLSLYSMSSWTRAIIVPLMIVNHYRPLAPTPEGGGIDELRGDRRAERTLYVESRNGTSPWKRVFVSLDPLLKLWSRRPIAAVRGRALRKARSWILRRQHRSDGLGAIWPGIVNTAFALKCLGLRDGDPVLERTIGQMLGLVIEDGGRLKVQPCKSPVWDTALTMIGWLRAGMPAGDPALARAAKWLLDREVRLPGDWRVRRPRAAPGGWYFEYANEFYPDLDDTAVVVMALACVDLGPEQPVLQSAVDRALAWVLAMQNRDGGWGAFDADNRHPILCDLPFADHNAILDPSTPDLTGRVLEMCGRLGFTEKEPEIARAVRFLIGAQEPDGSWFGRWGVNHIYGTAAVLVALNAVRHDMTAPEVVRAAGWIERVQNPDGGWGERCDSYHRPDARGRGESTPSQTAWAMLALMAAGRWDSPALARGAEYLLAGQESDGAWRERNFTGTGFPSVFYLKYHFYPRYFPLMALGAYRARSLNSWPIAISVKPSLAAYRRVPARPRLKFPLHQSLTIGKYILGRKLRRQARFPMVLMLEPLHRCNLACAGCGRIKEYRDLMGSELSLAECLDSAAECGAPVVSVCGGEPLIYKDIAPLVAGLVAQGRYVYLCTNGQRLAAAAPEFTPHKRLILNLHLDGPRALHDAITGRPGSFDRAVAGIAAARARGFRVTTNTTFYATTKPADLRELFEHLLPYGVEGHTVSPAYAFAGAEGGDEFFLSREEIKARFGGLRALARRFPLLCSPVYLDFLLGTRDLPCAPWANPTRNVAGWRAPCYLLLDRHYPTFKDYSEGVDWENLGPGKDRRCRDCAVHAGFEPSAVLGGGAGLRDILRIARWQLG